MSADAAMITKKGFKPDDLNPLEENGGADGELDFTISCFC
jgi:hypothetical protein